MQNGGKHPNDINAGNVKLPSRPPNLPHIIISDTFIVLQLNWLNWVKDFLMQNFYYLIEVGNRETVTLTNAFVATEAMAT